MESIEAAFRCFVEPSRSRKRGRPEYDDIPDRILVFDAETTADPYQNLLFGSFQIYNHGHKELGGLFHGDGLTEKQMDVLRKRSAELGMDVLSREEFVEKVFFPEVHGLGTLCVGFNLPFDLSRLAIKFSQARGKNARGFSLQLSENPKFPRLVIKSLDSKRSFIKFTSSLKDEAGSGGKRGGTSRFRGNFLDLRTLVFALTDEGHSLESACILFDTETKKSKAKEHGKVTPDYIDYNMQDVAATYSLYMAGKKEYKKYHLDVPLNRLYSPASIGKGYFEQMNIETFLEKNRLFSFRTLGCIAQTFYGGRAEVRIRKISTPVVLLDFLSMYPTVCILQRLWRYVVADRINEVEDTEGTRAFLEAVDLDLLSRRETWTKLNAICLVEPKDDILPVRAKYGQRDAYNIGVNYVTSDRQLWYALADVVASKLLTGRCPRVVQAIRFVPSGMQRGLQPIEMVGGKKLDPETDDFFLALMEHRDFLKRQRDVCNKDDRKYSLLDVLQKQVKIVTNATSYGIFVEINTEDCKGDILRVYGGEDVFDDVVVKDERTGRHFNPVMATLITSAARLVLSIAETILTRHGEHYAFCDTDSMAIPPSMVKDIQSYFQQLTPYAFPHELFKLEKENFGEDGKTVEPLFFYGISSKRYVLYSMRDGRPHIRKYSSHGLGHLMNPFANVPDREWEKEIWQAILDEVHGLTTNERTDRYGAQHAISQMTIGTWDVMRRFKRMNKGKPYSGQIKPFNFALVGTSCEMDQRTCQPIRPLAPFDKVASRAVHDDFIDYTTGRTRCGEQYWKTLSDTIWSYKNKREDKFAGDTGWLERKHLFITKVRHIGKESNDLEMIEIIGVDDDSYVKYASEDEKENEKQQLREFILSLKPKKAARFGLNEKWLNRARKSVKENRPLVLRGKTRRRLAQAMRASPSAHCLNVGELTHAPQKRRKR